MPEDLKNSENTSDITTFLLYQAVWHVWNMVYGCATCPDLRVTQLCVLYIARCSRIAAVRDDFTVDVLEQCMQDKCTSVIHMYLYMYMNRTLYIYNTFLSFFHNILIIHYCILNVKIGFSDRSNINRHFAFSRMTVVISKLVTHVVLTVATSAVAVLPGAVVAREYTPPPPPHTHTYTIILLVVATTSRGTRSTVLLVPALQARRNRSGPVFQAAWPDQQFLAANAWLLGYVKQKLLPPVLPALPCLDLRLLELYMLQWDT